MPIERIEIKDLDDIGMPQSRHHPGFPLESQPHALFLFDMTVQNFNGYRPV